MWQEGIVDGVHPFQCYRDTVDKLCKAQNWVPAAYLHFPIKDECLPDYDLTIEFLTKLLQRIEHGGKPETKEERLEKIKKQVVAQQAKLEAGQHLHVRGL